MARKKAKTMQMAEAMLEVPNPHRERVPQLRQVRGEWQYHENRVRVARALRDDPLGQMHSRRQVGRAQYEAGRRYQRTREAMGIGTGRSPGDIREHTDGGQIASDGITDRQLTAAKQIAAWRALLGEDAYQIVEAVLIDKRGLRDIADTGTRMMPGKDATKAVGHVFRRALSVLAKAMGLA